MNDYAYLVLVVGVVMVGLYLSNIIYDLKVPNYLSRKIGHAAGGLGFLISVALFSSGWWLFGITAGFVIILWLARRFRPGAFRGVGGSGRDSGAMSEIWFPLSALPVILLGWVWWGRPVVVVACLLFMAWGDCVTGIVRSQIYHRAVKGLWGSAAMLVVCLIIAWAFINPFWVGAVGAFAATVIEWAAGDVGILKWADDNWAIPVGSFIVVFGLLAVTGGIWA